MIPVLHPADSTSWGSFGLGALSDAVSCEVTEERNGQYELEMMYPVSGQHYSDLELRAIILAKPNFNDNPQPFRIYNISKPLNGIVTVNAQHLCYDLSGYVDGAFSAVGVQSALIALTANCTPSPCPFTFASDMSEAAGTLTVIKPTSIRALMGGTSGSLIDHWHGEWSYNGFACRFDANRGTDRGVTIRYGKNLTSIKQDENNANVYTGIYPYWCNQDTKAVVTLPEKVINAPGTFSFTKICPVDLSDRFEEEPTEAQLRAAAQAYIDSNDIGVPVVNLQLGFVQLEEIKERVDLCDTVHVYFDALGVNASAKCVRTRWNVLTDQYIKIELGSIRASIASTITGIKETADQAYTATSTLADTARTVSERVTGQLGGYVVINDTDNDGEPDEILIMDAADKEEAVNVIRMNNGGIAFSQDGYHGTYGTAWSIDGQFVADYITSGVLQANLIRILGTTNFYWDAGNIYIINPNDSGQQIRIGQYDGTRYGIGFTRDGGVTWQTAMDFQGLNVQATGFSKVYISLTPPDPADYGLDTFNIGDIWVESEHRYSWNEVEENTWSWAAQHTWNFLGGETDPNMYTWNGGSWQKIYDGESFVSFETRLTVAEQEIAMAVASVADKGVTYIRLTDPRNDSSVIVNMGDHWIKAEPGYSVVTWYKAATMSWNTLAATYDWNSMDGPKEYAWDGYNWILVSDHGAEVRHSTAIIENDKAIALMSQAQATMNNQLVENSAQLTIQANQIASEVSQRINGERQLSSQILQSAQIIMAEVSSDYIAKSYVSISDNKIELSSLKFNSLGSSGSGIYITPTQVKISSGGTFSLTSTYFNVATDGTITAKAGKIGGWDIASDMLSKTITSGSYEYKVMLYAPSSISESTAAFAIRVKQGTSETYPFFVRYDGAMVSSKGEIAGWEITSNNIQRLSTVYPGSATTQYGAFMSSPNSISAGTMAFAIGSRSWNGSSYGAWTYPFYVDYSGRLTATAATIKGNITVDSITFSSGVTMSAANLTDGTIATAKIGNGQVTYAKGSSGVKTSLDNGDAAYASFSSLTSGSVSASYIKTDKLWVGSGGVYVGNTTDKMSRMLLTVGSNSYYVIGKSI